MEHNSKIIVCGWWFDKFDNQENQTDFIEQLKYINDNNENIEVFWACHKDPIDLVKNNFNWKLYENVGLEWGVYNKAFSDLEFKDDDFVFCIQDDMVIKDWGFIEVCQEHLVNDEIKIIGNGFNYPYNMNPLEEARLSYWLKTKDRWVDYVRPENQHMFKETIQCLSIRGSFLATRWKHIKLINGFEYVNAPLSNGIKEDGTEFVLIDPFGNTSLYLNAYKFSKYFGNKSFKWLSNTYRKSKWMTECGRGNVDLPQDAETTPFNVPQEFLIDGYEYEEDIRNFDTKHLSYVEINNKPFKEFKSFLDSLDVEKKSWSLDLQTFKDEKAWYDFHINGASAYFLLYKNEIIGLINGYMITYMSEDPLNLKQFEISFVVKNRYQGNGLGTQLLLILERELENKVLYTEGNECVIKTLVAKHYKDNIASHKAFIKAGWMNAKVVVDDKHHDQRGELVFKMKEINSQRIKQMNKSNEEDKRT